MINTDTDKIPKVPRFLKIKMNTPIPGYPITNYEPSMTIKNIGKDKNVQFYPLAKLNKEVINNIPEDLRIKQFFDAGYFNSLVNETLIKTGSSPAKNLGQATYYGYIDNNIKITLNTIFPEDSVIYIGGKPYVIADVLWTNGDWRIDTKFKEEVIDPNKISDPYLYSSIVRDDIISGEQDLASLSPSVIYGNNYVGTLDIARGVTGTGLGPGVGTGLGPGLGTGGPLPPGPGGPGPGGPGLGPGGPGPPGPSGISVTPIINISMTGPAAPIINVTSPPPPTPLLIGLTGPAASTSLVPYTGVTNNYYYYYGPNKKLLINDSDDEGSEDDIDDKPTVIVEIRNANAFKTNLPVTLNGLSKKKLNDTVFKKTNYYNLLNMLYQTNTNASMAKMINTTLSETTNIKVKQKNITYSQNAYNKSLSNFHMLENAGGGDCFFIALSDAINLYNNDIYNNLTSTPPNIISYIDANNREIDYGIDAPFTTPVLRNIVYEYYLNNIDNAINIAVTNAGELNNLVEYSFHDFNQNIESTNLTRETFINAYIVFINQIYYSTDNFLVYLPTKEFIDENEDFNYRRPFLALPNMSHSYTEEYFLSNRYWGDQFALTAICRALSLNIIILSYDNTQAPSVSIDYGVFREGDHNNCNDWNKYLFLFHYGNHYELMSFDYFYRIQNRNYNSDIIEKPKYIFQKEELEFPPFYIFFFIYGCKYFGLEREQKLSFTWYPVIMSQIDEIVNVILQDEAPYTKNGTPKNALFIRYFNQFFIKNQINADKNLITKGGAYGNPYYDNNFYDRPYDTPYDRPYGNPYRTPYGRPGPYLARNMLTQNYTDSKLAYYITIDLELYPGTEISPEIKKQLKCRQKWNAVRKAYANFRGLPYIVQPIYSYYTPENKKDRPNNSRKKLNNARTRNGGTKKMRTSKNNIL